MECDRYWLLTSTTYGTRLPGEQRGFVGPVADGRGGHVIHNVPQTPYDEDLPALRRHARAAMKGEPVFLRRAQAEVVWVQFQETAAYRHWQLLAAAVMTNHFHLVVGTPGDPDPATMLRDFKSYASRALSRRWKRPESGTWWTESGSRRKLPHRQVVLQAIHYVKHQLHPLVLWYHEEFRDPPGESNHFREPPGERGM